MRQRMLRVHSCSLRTEAGPFGVIVQTCVAFRFDINRIAPYETHEGIYHAFPICLHIEGFGKRHICATGVDSIAPTEVENRRHFMRLARIGTIMLDSRRVVGAISVGAGDCHRLQGICGHGV